MSTARSPNSVPQPTSGTGFSGCWSGACGGSRLFGNCRPSTPISRTSHSARPGLPNFYLFALLVYGLEVLTAVSLMLGLFVRLGGVIGALQIVNLWLGLYSAPNEWPWTYFFLIVLQLVFASDHYGRSLGVDALLVTRSSRSRLLKLIA